MRRVLSLISVSRYAWFMWTGLAVINVLLEAGNGWAQAGPHHIVDLATQLTDSGFLQRVYGSVGTGVFGVPVAGGIDGDGDSLPDTVMAAMTARPFGRLRAGEVYMIFGTGAISGAFDTAPMTSKILKIAGAGPQEMAGSEIWMDDLTGDGVGELLIARQNYTPAPNRIGAGALTILIGGPAMRDYAETLQYLDLSAPPATVNRVTIVGATALDRLGIWMRTGDITGDGIADLVVGADQESTPGEPHRGAVYIIHGGPHLDRNLTIDLAAFGATPLARHMARIVPPAGAAHYHFGATCQIADLDGNGRGEVLIAAALQRAGASLVAQGAPIGSAHSSGGTPHGTLYIAWDDNFPAPPWPAGYRFNIASPPGSHSIIHGGEMNVAFGEEIAGGLDYDNDGGPDLFVGDIAGDASMTQDRIQSGAGYVWYQAETLKGLELTLDTRPPEVRLTTFIGADPGDIAGDTAAQGDFDGDGIADLAFSAPHGNPPGRVEAGIFYIIYGQDGGWPALIDLLPAALPPAAAMRMTHVYGARGRVDFDQGDVLGYSAAAGDIDGDGKIDLIANEMLGNGLRPGAVDTGNAIVISGARLTGPPPTVLENR